MTTLTSTSLVADLFRGACELETTAAGVLPHRLPASARTRADQQLLAAEACPSGVRLALRTAATVVEVDAVRTTTAFRGVPPRPDGIYDLVVDGTLAGQQRSSGGRRVVIDLATGVPEIVDGPADTMHEDTPGPGAIDVADGTPRFGATGDPADVADGPVGKLSLRAVREELARVVALRRADDPALHLLDGLTLYGEADAEGLPLPDRLHPDGPTHRLIGERFAAHAFGPGGPFATTRPPTPVT